MNGSKRVLPHGPLERLADGLWQVTGSLPRMALPRNMLVHRLADGRLWIHSAVLLDEAGMHELESLGTPAFLVVPNVLHKMDARAYQRRYPAMRILCPTAVRDAVAKTVSVHGTVEAELPPLGIEVMPARGVKHVECVYRLPIKGYALAFCDLIFNVPHQPGFGGKILRWIGSSGDFGMTKIGRRYFLKDAELLAGWLDSLAETSPAIVTMAHGNAVVRDAAERLRYAARRIREGK